MNLINNLDLFSVGTMVVTTCVLGFAVYFNNRKSITNKVFLMLTIDMAIWGVFNYFSYKSSNPDIAIWLIRIVLLTAVFQSILIFKLFLVFPNQNYIYNKFHSFIILLGVLVSLLTLTPLIFSKIIKDENSIKIIKGDIWILFALVAALFTFSGLFILISKIFKSEKNIRKPLLIILFGLIITYSLIFLFNLISPTLYNDTKFIPLGSLFLFPFIACTSYAILKHDLFKLKVTETTSLIILLLIITFLQVVFSKNISEVIFRSSVFVIVLFLCILLLKIVIREIQQRKEIQNLAQKLEESNTKLVALDSLKSEFISLATHHISTPLTAINGYISMLEEGDFAKNSDAEKETYATLHRLTNSMITITKEFIDVSNVDDGKIEYIFNSVDLKKLLNNVIADFEQKVKAKDVAFDIAIDSSNDYTVSADYSKLQKALSNILSNSLRSTEKGKVIISLTVMEKYFKIKISDSGIRKLPKLSQTLLEKFAGSSEYEANIFGNNFGVYYAKQIIESHRGKFTIQSNNNGKETIFTILLPKHN